LARDPMNVPVPLQLLLATRNAHKAQEIQAILRDRCRCVTLNECPGAPQTIEDAGTFAGNASKKAGDLARWLSATRPSTLDPRPAFVVADDSGLEVDALNGAPGVNSARFAALDTTLPGNSPDADNNVKLLRLLQDVPMDRRAARFRCVIALAATHQSPAEADARPPRVEWSPARLFEGVCEGRIGFAPRGRNGFGYDPLFIPTGYDLTFAELGAEIKNRLSHRARALASLKQWLESNVLPGDCESKIPISVRNQHNSM
jgi:XTP/dITP diphosphohydrolase